MSILRADSISNRTGTGAPTFPNGVQVTGVATATSFSGALTGNVTGNINSSGISTLGNTVVGGGTTQLVVTGNARITGILTIGTSSITLDGSNNQVNVGTGVTLHHTNGVQVGGNTLHSTVLTVNQISASGVSTFSSGIVVAAGSTAAPSITPTGDSNTGIFFPSADTIAFGEGGAEAARIDSSGRLLIGTSSAESIYRISSVNYAPLIQVKGGAFPGGSLALTGTDGGAFWLTSTTTQSVPNGELGLISFNGYDGTNYLAGARIQVFTDGTCGANDLPTRIVFSTTADSAPSPTEAMRINNQRELLIGTTTRTANGGVLQVSNGITFPATQSACSNANTLDDYEEGEWTPNIDNAYFTTPGTTYTSRAGRYVKVGKMVLARFTMTIAGVSNSGVGPFFFGGLPFSDDTSDISSRGLQASLYISGINTPAGAVNVNLGYAILDNGNYYLTLSTPIDDANSNNSRVIQASDVSNGDVISGTIMYIST